MNTFKVQTVKTLFPALTTQSTVVYNEHEKQSLYGLKTMNADCIQAIKDRCSWEHGTEFQWVCSKVIYVRAPVETVGAAMV